MSLEQTSQTKQKTKLGYDQIQAEQFDSSSNSTRSGQESRENRTDINRTSESVQSGTKESVSSGESKSVRAVDQTQARNVVSSERVNLGFQLTFTVPLTGIIPTNSNGTSC